jgi:hypothetical protein
MLIESKVLILVIDELDTILLLISIIFTNVKSSVNIAYPLNNLVILYSLYSFYRVLFAQNHLILIRIFKYTN